jgi:hypothetical protein
MAQASLEGEESGENLLYLELGSKKPRTRNTSLKI